MSTSSKNTGVALLAILVCLTSLALTSYAQTENALTQIKARVDGRKAEISQLRSDGLIKEDASGRLDPIAQLTEQQNAVVEEENRDRDAAFSLIASENGLSSGDVVQLFSSGSRARANATPPSSPPSAPSPAQTAPSQSEASSDQGTSPTPASSQSSTTNPTPQPSSSTANASASPSATAPTTAPTAQPPPAIDNSLPAKLINRPASSLYAEASEASTKVQENMKGFMVYYIVDQTPGWFQVASTQGGSPLGWLQESEAILWQHNLAVRFAHEARGNRLQVPFFGASPELENVLRMSDTDRKAVNLSAVGNPNRDKAEAAGVIAVQPPVVSRNEFYVLPITQHQKLAGGQFPALNRPAMMLRVAAMKQQGSATPAPQPSGGRLPPMDVVFVMDLTASMGPFVQATLEAMRDLAGSLESSGRSDSFRFGLWGYKDSKPDQDFGDGRVTKNFTPALQERSDFVRTLQGVRVSSISAGDWPESVLDGVNDAIKDTNWTANAMRIIVLVGDASSHPLSNEAKNPSRLDEGSVRALATQNNCYIMPLYIKANSLAARDDADKARPQFNKLAQNPNLSGASFFATVNQGESQSSFRDDINDEFFAKIFSNIERVANGESAQSLAASAPQNPTTVAQMTDSIFSGAYLDWVAAQEWEAEAVGSNLQGWVLEKDLVNTDVQALDVVFLITRSQLDTLKKSLDKIIDAYVKSEIRGVDFFSRIQNIVGQAAVNPSQISSSTDEESLRGFLQGLPYDSEVVLKLTAEAWRKMNNQERDALVDRCQSHIAYYETVNADTAQWRPLNDGDDPTAYVAAIPLNRLP